MSSPRRLLDRLLLPPFAERLAEGRPVITREQALSVSQQVMAMTSSKTVTVTIAHTAKSFTQLASDRVRNMDDGDTLRVGIRTQGDDLLSFAYMTTNQLDEAALRALVARADAIGQGMIGWSDQGHVHPRDMQDSYPATTLWRESTVRALRSARETAIPKIIETVRKSRLRTSGFVGLMARAQAVLTEGGIAAFSEETDSEISVTARPMDGTTTGWSGVAARDWSSINPEQVAADAAEMAQRNLHPQAVEPGRRTAILAPGAVVQLMRFLALHFDGVDSDEGQTGFSKVPDQKRGSRFGERLFDPRVNITTDPTDPEGGFRPWFARGYVSHPTTWIEGGVLKYLAYGIASLEHGKPYAEMPFGFRLHGGDTTIEQMISACDEGIYVNRFSDLDILDWHTGMMTGATRDGCFLVKHGKIDRPVKNFRFQTSPFFVLNNIVALGPSRRAPYAYAPWTNQERVMAHMDWRSEIFDWPRRPMIVPAMMVHDFNFSALIDAV